MDNLVNRANFISDSLNSKGITDYLGQWHIDKMVLLKMVIESKIGYDRLCMDPENKNFFNEIDESIVYSTELYSELVLLITAQGDPKTNFENSQVLNLFYLFHKMIFRTASLISNLISKVQPPEKNNAEVFHLGVEEVEEESYDTFLKKLSGF